MQTLIWLKVNTLSWLNLNLLVWFSVSHLSVSHLSVCQEQQKLKLKRDVQESVRNIQLRDPSTAQVCVCVRLLLLYVSVCGAALTWLPCLPTEVACGHIRCSGVAAAAANGETEVTALPETQQQPVMSLLVPNLCISTPILSHYIIIHYILSNDVIMLNSLYILTLLFYFILFFEVAVY